MIVSENNLLITAKELIAFNIPEGTIRSGKSENIKGASSWRFIEIDGTVHFIYNCLPKKTKEKIPHQSDLVATLTLEKYNDNIERIVRALIHQKNDGFHKYYNIINDKYVLSKECCREFAQRWACWVWIVENYSRSGSDLKYLVPAYNKVFPGHLSDDHSFCNFRKKCQVNGIEAQVIDNRVIRKQEKRITSFQLAFLQSQYIQPQKIVTRTAHANLVKACKGIGESPYSLASVKLYFKQFSHNAELYAARYGQSAAQKELPFATLLPAEHRNTQWQIDGWTLPFWGDQYQRYILYLIRDNHSRKIVGYSVAISENTTLILDALDDAIRNTSVFPGELVSDKHSFHKTEIAARLRLETEKMGAVWTVTVNAQRNQLAERYNQYLDAICKDFEGYTGKNITAKSKDARPSPETQEENGKPRNWKTGEEVKAIASYIVLEFNRTKLDILDKQSPNEKYNASESTKAFALSEAERIALLRPVSTCKVIRGQIIIKQGMRKHEFQLPAALIDRYNNQKIAVVYEDLEQGIYISDLHTGEELGCIAPKRKIHGAIPDQTPADIKMLNQQTGRKNGTVKKARKTVQQRINEALAENPEAIEIINAAALPKDIRQLATQDSEFKKHLAEQGQNINMLPIRKQKAATINMNEDKAMKTRDRPFAVKKTEMKFMTFDELLNPENESDL